MRGPRKPPGARPSGARCAPRSLASLVRSGAYVAREGSTARPLSFPPGCVSRLHRTRTSVLAAGRRRDHTYPCLHGRTRVGCRRARRPLARGCSRLSDAPASSAVSVAPRRAFAFQPRGHLRARATPRRGCSETPSPGHDSRRAGPRTDLKLASPPSRGHHCATCVRFRSIRFFARARQAGRGRERET